MVLNKNRYNLNLLFLVVFILAILLNPFVIIKAGERGVLMKFGEVQQPILGEGLHIVIPLANAVQKLSVRIQKQEISAEASSKDLQEIFTNVVLNWHIIPEESNAIFQAIGNEREVVEKIINPAVEEVLKAVIAKYTAESIITHRSEVKAVLDERLTNRLKNYHIQVDDISLVRVRFSQQFAEAVEAKQVAEQEAKQAGFTVLKSLKEAESKVNLAKGEAEVQKLLQETLTPQILQKQVIDKWDGKLPSMIGGDAIKTLEESKFMVK